MKQRLLCGLALALVMFTGACQTLTTRQNIAATCETAASALQVITVGHKAGRVSDSQLRSAIALYETAVIPVCSPKPVASLSAVDYDALIAAAAQLALTEKEAKP
jgi:3-polyprenyl-4-hydroxybenzoate decarboxylase